MNYVLANKLYFDKIINYLLGNLGLFWAKTVNRISFGLRSSLEHKTRLSTFLDTGGITEKLVFWLTHCDIQRSGVLWAAQAGPGSFPVLKLWGRQSNEESLHQNAKSSTCENWQTCHEEKNFSSIILCIVIGGLQTKHKTD